MEKLVEDGLRATGELIYKAGVGFVYLAGAGVGLLVLRFGADNGIAVFNAGVEALKAIIA